MRRIPLATILVWRLVPDMGRSLEAMAGLWKLRDTSR